MATTIEQKIKEQWSGTEIRTTRTTENLPMHPDDFAGLMSWIMAKRLHETGREGAAREMPVYFRILG